MNRFSVRRAPQSLLALSLAGGRLVAAQIARSKNAVSVVRQVSSPLSLDPLHPEPELVGREIRGLLDAARIKERACIVVLPPEWVMTQQSALPELSSEDTESLLSSRRRRVSQVRPRNYTCPARWRARGVRVSPRSLRCVASRSRGSARSCAAPVSAR